MTLVYDSQYIKDMCTKPAHAPPPQKNRPVITLVKQLLNDATNRVDGRADILRLWAPPLLLEGWKGACLRLKCGM